ncbi:leucine-rich repeat domain-containing protein [Acaryochloris marina NIES-2412]|uniref:leucine-rich repeat domain-containing protein n=1 Tax=Acaryochloris marina TaxID=155978 RepID=UPI00405902F5
MKRFSKGIVVLVVLATGLCNSDARKYAVVLANSAREDSTLLAQSEQMTQDRGYAEAQRRIRVAQETQASELDLEELSLTQLPSEIWQLTNLQRLFLWDNKLRKLPPEISQLTNLHRLDLLFNKLSSLPIEIEKLHQSTTITLKGNPLPPHILKQYDQR